MTLNEVPMTKMSSAIFIVNLAVGGSRPGARLTLKVDKDGTPLDKYWRRRWKDSRIDNCISRVDETPEVPQESVNKPKKAASVKKKD